MIPLLNVTLEVSVRRGTSCSLFSFTEKGGVRFTGPESCMFKCPVQCLRVKILIDWIFSRSAKLYKLNIHHFSYENFSYK